MRNFKNLIWNPLSTEFPNQHRAAFDLFPFSATPCSLYDGNWRVASSVLRSCHASSRELAMETVVPFLFPCPVGLNAAAPPIPFAVADAGRQFL